ncbi:hypothetical protein THAOC_15892 [Thalassiosira oceanica]|uniref:Uncharacterized protein n=1 Tax=Thalassiosira oceanica TaxID=159749 RepID=K0SBC3_THAOC|nr:hypothetical protein THAOC_15892 [Thalassiosira oceanica]|eukprot:EJK63443.1 hypothetical protein THAOC_15892 [Thalassiosira oceanica]
MKKSINNCRNKKSINKRAAISAVALGRALVCAAAFSANPRPRPHGTITALEYRSSGDYGWPTISDRILKPHDEHLSAESNAVPNRGEKALRWMMPATLSVPPERSPEDGRQLEEYIAYCEKRYRDRVMGGSKKHSVSFSSQTQPAASGMAAARRPSAVGAPNSPLNRLQYSLISLDTHWGTATRGVMSFAFSIFSRALGAVLVRSEYKQSTTAIVSLATIVALLVLRPLTRQV